MGTDKGSIYLRLKQGYPIICSMGKGVFTTNGHYIVLSGIEKGKIKVKDPNSIIRSNVLWDFETLDVYKRQGYMVVVETEPRGKAYE